jgi:Zn-dependent protease
VGRIAGIDLAIDRSWILIFLLITYSLGSRFAAEHAQWEPAATWTAAVFASLLFFTSLVLHELGHSITAIHLGVGVRSITLFLFGGIAALESEPKRPRDEIVIALAGPAVSLGLGFGFMGAASVLPEGPRIMEVLRSTFGWLGMINVILAVFNVLPGFPLDGGRVLRGLVWSATGSFERATRAAAASGSYLAYALMSLGALSAVLTGQILGGLWLVFIGWFLLTTARMSVTQMTLESILSQVRANEVMEPVTGLCLTGAESVAEVAEASILRRGMRTFYVVDARGGLRGLVTLAEIAATPAERRPLTRVEEIMLPAERLETLDPGETTWAAFRKMAERNVNQLPVLEAGRLLGSVTRERLVGLVQAGVALRA